MAKDAQSGRGQLKKQSLMRARRSSSEDADTSLRAVLSLETPTYLMSHIEDRDVEERQISHRLVRFARVQNGMLRGVRV